MERASLLYRLIRPLARLALQVNFRKIYFSNAQVVPKNKPVILAVNHPSAFLEACLLACLLPRPLHFLARGNLFIKSFYSKVLKTLHIIPVYRLHDRGYSFVRKNYESFEHCYSALADGQMIMILAEGTTIQEKRLRPIRKGTARLAFGALSTYPDLDLQIVPVGVNFTYADRFRSRVMFSFGQPIELQDYLDTHREQPQRAIRELTQRLKQDLEKEVIQIQDTGDEALVEHLFQLNRNSRPEAPFPIVSPNNHLFKSEWRIAQSVSGMSALEKVALQKQVDNYQQNLSTHKMNDYAVVVGRTPELSNLITIIVGYVPHWLGYLGNFLPTYLAHYIGKYKVEEIEFKASVKLAVTIPAFLLYYLILAIIAISSGQFVLLLLVSVLPFAGYYALMYREYRQKWQNLRALHQIDEAILEQLQQERRKIWSFLSEDA